MQKQDFKPEFYKAFQCVGPKCSDSCCTHWHIFVDQPTYEFMLYKSKLKALTPNAMVRITDGAAYAEINLDAHKKCRLLDDEGWCRVQQEDGLEHLSDTCRLYPRKALSRGSLLTEHVLVLSCPEVVRMLIDTPDLMTFERPALPAEPESADEAQTIRRYRRPEGYKEQQTWMYDVIDDTKLCIEEKLFILSDGMSRLNRYVGHPTNFIQHLIAMAQPNFRAEQLASLHQYQAKTSQHAYLYLRFLELLQSKNYAEVMSKSPRLGQLLHTLKTCLQGQERPILHVSNVLSQPQVFYQMYMQARPWVWTNYLLYRMYVDDVPSVTSGQFFYYFLFEFFYMQTSLKILAAQGALKDEDVIWVIQSFHKSIAGRTFVRLMDELERDHQRVMHSPLKPIQLLCLHAPMQAQKQEQVTP